MFQVVIVDGDMIRSVHDDRYELRSLVDGDLVKLDCESYEQALAECVAQLIFDTGDNREVFLQHITKALRIDAV